MPYRKSATPPLTPQSASGRAAALANLSARQAKAAGLLTSGTFGPPSTTLSSNAALNLSLASRLHTVALSLGSILYRMTWRRVITPSGRCIYRLAASADPTYASALIGWPTPQTMEGRKGRLKKDGVRDPSRRGSYYKDLKDDVLLAPWATPTARDFKSTKASEEYWQKQWASTRGKPLSAEITLLGWPTPQSFYAALFQKGEASTNYDKNRRAKGGNGGPSTSPRAASLRVRTSGGRVTGCTARTPCGGPLNPAHPRWMQGLPPAWDDCAPTATR